MRRAGIFQLDIVFGCHRTCTGDDEYMVHDEGRAGNAEYMEGDSINGQNTRHPVYTYNAHIEGIRGDGGQ